MTELHDTLREHLVEMSIIQYITVRQTYYDAVHGLIYDYLAKPVTNYRSFQSKMNQATIAAYSATAKSADGKAKDLWLRAKVALALLFIAKLWDDLWQIKKSREQTAEAITEAEQIAITHAENYCRGLDGVWNEARVRQAGDTLLTLQGIDGKSPEFPCVTCDSLKGQTHPASWWIKNNLVPYQGNQNYVCGCWGCKHGLFDAKGIQYTL